MKKLVLVLGVLLMLGCTRKIYIPIETTHTVTETLHDTVVQVKLDVVRDSIHVKDTISHLDNKYAETWAKWVNGELYHSLKMKDVSTPVKVVVKNTTKVDSIQVPYPVKGDTVYVNKLNWYQNLCVWGFSIVLGGCLVGLIVWLVKKRIITI